MVSRVSCVSVRSWEARRDLEEDDWDTIETETVLPRTRLIRGTPEKPSAYFTTAKTYVGTYILYLHLNFIILIFLGILLLNPFSVSFKCSASHTKTNITLNWNTDYIRETFCLDKDLCIGMQNPNWLSQVRTPLLFISNFYAPRTYSECDEEYTSLHKWE